MGNEKKLETSITKYIEIMGWIVKKQHSGSVLVKKGSKVYKIQLWSKWTADLSVEINQKHFHIEVKKNKQEYDKWIKLEKKVLWWEILPKSYHRELAQINEKYYILKRWWRYILTYSLQDFIKKLTNYE